MGSDGKVQDVAAEIEFVYQARMIAESVGAGSDGVDDVDCIRDYVCYLCANVASGRLLSTYLESHNGYFEGTGSNMYISRNYNFEGPTLTRVYGCSSLIL